ncbi:MAG: hypothetical protein AB7P40_29975, partial [Chloroflexota bacterium]
MAVRTTVQIDPALMRRVKQLVLPRGFNQFVNEALAARADAIERARLEREMIDGYLATHDDRTDLSQDWEQIDIEGWPT